MKCTDCCWNWQGDEDDFPCCHCEGIVPCENEDEDRYFEMEDDEDDMGYSELNFDALVDYRNIGNYTP